MRARNIKPGFFKNEELGMLEPIDRLLFAGLWCLADRSGRLEDRPLRIKAEIMPWDDRSVAEALDALCKTGFIIRYEKDGKSYIQITNFAKHQNPHFREAESVIPPPDGFGEENAPKKRGRKPKNSKEISDNSKGISDNSKNNSKNSERNSHEKSEFFEEKTSTEDKSGKCRKNAVSSQKTIVGNSEKASQKAKARCKPGASRADSLIPDSLIPDSLIPDSGLSLAGREAVRIPPAAIAASTDAASGRGRFCGYSGQRMYDINALERAIINAEREREYDTKDSG